jgi:hypothetical protein
MYQLFISTIFHLICLDHSRLGITKTTKSKIEDKEAQLYFFFPFAHSLGSPQLEDRCPKNISSNFHVIIHHFPSLSHFSPCLGTF